MFANSRQRSQSQSHTHYRPQEYYLPATPPLSLPFQDSNPRSFAQEHNRVDMYPYPSEHSPHPYHNTERNIGYDNRESLSPTTIFNKSYDRRSSGSSDSHVPHHAPYHNHQQTDSGRLDLAGPTHSKPIQTQNILDNISIAPYHQSFPSEQRSAPIASASEHSGGSELWQGDRQTLSPEHQKPRKARREKPRIELAPDQPPTTQGKPRARVYVACLQWFVLNFPSIHYSSSFSKFLSSRTRKIRCDGAKPVCHNCGRRANGNSESSTAGNKECNYDPIPKRRGPDKTPGARQRMARDVRNEIDKSGVPSRRRRRGGANSASGSNQTSHQQPQARQDMSADSPPILGAVYTATTNNVPPSLSPRSSNSNTGEFLPVQYGRSYSPEILSACPGILDVGGLSNRRKPVAPVSANC